MAVTCGACGRDASAGRPVAVYTKLNRRYIECPACGSFQLDPFPPVLNEAFEGEEAADHHVASDAARHGYFARRLAMATAGRERGRLLEVGCGTGALLEQAREAGWQIEGVELSTSLAARARQRLPGTPIHTQDISTWIPEPGTTFDVVVALDVIEHVTSPGDLLRCLYGLLVPGGLLLLQTPNARSIRARLHRDRWNMLIPEYHLTLFSPEGMRIALEDGGFVTRRLTTASGGGNEQGARRVAARGAEALLAAMRMGNGLLVVAERPRDQGFAPLPIV